MSNSKTYAAYFPYKYGHAGKGIEYDFCGDESYIDYDEYFSMSLKTYLDYLEDRYIAYCDMTSSNSLKLDAEQPHSLLNNSKIFNQESFEALLIDKYNAQKEFKDTDPWYGFILLNSEFISSFLSKLGQNNSINRNILDYLFNKNKYLTGSINNSTGTTSNVTINTYSPTIEKDGNMISNPNYTNRDFYIGVGDYADINNENLTYSFRYTEFKKKTRRFQYLVNKIQIFAPLGTMFYLNRNLQPIYVNKEYQLGQDSTIGVYELDTENYVNIHYLTFPRDAIPKIYTWNDSTQSLQESNDTEASIVVTYYYDNLMELPAE